MRREPTVQIECDEPVPQFAKMRVEDFLGSWHPNLHPLKDLATSLYLQGIADGFEAGERFAQKGGHLFTDDIDGVPV